MVRGWVGRRWFDRGGLSLLCILCVAVVFQAPLRTGLTQLLGEEYDGTIEVVLLEHWYAVFRGLEPWTGASYFHPYAGVLGYNDAFFASGLIYAPFRAIGVDPYRANACAQMVLKALGFAGMAWLLGRVVGMPLRISALGAALFTLANGPLMQMVHGQLLTLCIMPWLSGLVVIAGGAILEHDRATIRRAGIIAGLLFGLSAVNGFYMAWLFGYFVLATIVMLLAIGHRHVVRYASSAWQCRGSLLLVALVWLGALLPLLVVYLPRFAEGNAHGYVAAMNEMIGPLGIVNVGDGNLVWGWLNRRLLPGVGGEQISGFPLFLLALATAGGVMAVRRRATLLSAIAAATFLTWLSTVNFDGHSLWRITYTLVPGASALRALARLQLFLTLPVIVLAMYALSRIFRTRAVWPFVIAALVLAAEQVNTAPPVGISPDRQLARIAAIPPLPGTCRSFFIASNLPAAPHQSWEWSYVDEAEDREAPAHFDAMLLAALRRVPTINGYATFGPPDGLSDDTTSPAFKAAIRRYIARHQLRGVCGFDRRVSPNWFAYSPA